MYNKFYGLKEQPFNLTPDPRFIYFSEKHREALARMTFGVNMKRGFMSITGEVGTGKTTLIYALLSRLDADTQKAFIFHSIMGAKGLFRSICREFGIEMRSDDTKTDMTIRLHNFLISNFQSGNNAVLIIDEAQNLNPYVLEEIRLLSNLETTRSKLLQILLVGQPEFRQILDRPDMRQLKQRIAMKFHLGKLDRHETGEYISHRMSVARHQASGSNGSPNNGRREAVANQLNAGSNGSDEPLSEFLSWDQLRARKKSANPATEHFSTGDNVSLARLIDGEVNPDRGSKDIFSAAAIDEIYRYSGGIPRLINVVCDKALLMGYTMESRHITVDIIRRIEQEDRYAEAQPAWQPTQRKQPRPTEPPAPRKKKPAPFVPGVDPVIQKKPQPKRVQPNLSRLRKRFPNLFGA